MDRIAVTSSSLAEVGYDPVNSRLEIRFQNGGVYEYDHVPAEIFEGLILASSKGSYFQRRIRGRYRTRRVRNR